MNILLWTLKQKILFKTIWTENIDEIKRHMKMVYQDRLKRSLLKKSDSNWLKFEFDKEWSTAFMFYDKINPKLQTFNWACRTDQIKIHSIPINQIKPFIHTDIEITHSKRICKPCPVNKKSLGNNIKHILLECIETFYLRMRRDFACQNIINMLCKSNVPILIKDDGIQDQKFKISTILIGVTASITPSNKKTLYDHGITLDQWKQFQKSLIHWNFIILHKWKRLRFVTEFPNIPIVENPFNTTKDMNPIGEVF